MSEFSITLAQEFVESDNPFPVDFDLAWQWLGYSTKQKAKSKLVNNFDLDLDYVINQKVKRVTGNNGGGSVRYEEINLSVKCFIVWSMSSNSPKGKEICDYILSLLEGKNISLDDLDITSHPNKIKDNSGFVYLIKATKTNFYKMGMSKDPYKRLQSLQTGTPFELTILYRVFTFDCVALEKALHEYYQGYWLRGEWFDLPKSEVDNFIGVASTLDQEIELNLLPETI